MNQKPYPSTIILPKQPSKKLAKYCYNSVLNGTSLLVERGVFFDGHIEELAPLTFSLEKTNFLGLTGSDNQNSITVKQYKLNKGSIFYLPFSLTKYWENWQRSRRFISIGENAFVFEELCTIHKKNLHKIVVEVLKQAFFKSGVPYIHKWYFPGKNRSVFCFRGDADGGPKENYLQWLDTVKPYAENTSVFFCTSQYQNKKELIKASLDAGLEIGSHNHWHIVFPERLTNQISLRKSEDILKSANIVPRGFVAPAYFWHPSLYKLLEDKKYLYSSCFRINHDGLPYLPSIDGRLGKVLEIPFHCLGDRFPVSGIPLDDTKVYSFFKEIIAKKYAAAEPMFFYGHPDIEGRMGTTPELIRFIMETARSFSDVKPMQLSEYANWWFRRNHFKPQCVYDSECSELFFSNNPLDGNEDQSIFLRVEHSNGITYLINPNKSLNNGQIDKIPFNVIQSPNGDATGEVVYRGPDPKDSIFSWQKRKKIKRFLNAYKEVYI
ncbi:polysaccharide deacetylase family protein [uncultured Desulfobacter sp.]|uniref:polysaccharide deacetylase family protein n=1 Tax=uncultured Desulfobacter sp. TaxID=240139 RepID=UPI002AAB7379|nr:polysaccharide deacetylase family protein [uncultured Desulfobacter sp.]